MNFSKKEIISYLIIIGLVVFVRINFFTFVRVQGTSMEDTLYPKEILFLNKTKETYDYNNIVVINMKGNKNAFIKRIVALPNDSVEIERGQLYINTKKVKNEHLKGKLGDYPYTKLKSGEYFVLGDNLDVSLDSRTFGLINEDEIKGIVNTRIYPFNKFGKIEGE